MSENSEISIIWFNNIKKLDEKNRLAHGEIYAGDGSVHDFKIIDNKVTAKVDGAPGDVYDVEINFKKLSKTDRQDLIDFIEDNSAVYSKILNNQIPEELLDWKIKILPDSLKDFKMTCSCERGLFCKHKAALFHKLKSKIRKDPFLIFNLVGLDIKDEIKADSNDIKTIREVLRDENLAVLDNSGNINYLTKMNFMLSDNPSFYTSSQINFNDLLYDTLDSMSKGVFKIQNMEEKEYLFEFISLNNVIDKFGFKYAKSAEEIKWDFEDKWLDPQDWKSFKINLDGNYDIINISTGEKRNNFNIKDLKFQLFAFFAELNQIEFDEYCEDIKFLYELYLFSMHLIYINALIPEFFSLDNGEYHIRWMPIFDVPIFFNLKKFYDRCPENILTFYDTELSRQSMVNNLISIFFEGFATYYMYKLMPYEIRKYSSEFYFRLFFGKNQDFNNYNYSGRETEVDNWLAVLYLKQKNFNLSIDITQSDFEFALNLTAEIDGKNYSVNEILSDNRSDVVRAISIVENIFDKFAFSYNFSSPQSLTLREFTFFADKISPVLEDIGVSVEKPQELEEINDVKLILDTNVSHAPASLSIDDLVNFDWKVAIGDETYSIDEFKTFAQNYKGLVKIKDKFFMINGDKLEEIAERISQIPENKTKSEMLQYLLTCDEESIEIDEKLNKLLGEALEVKDVEVPDSLNGKLRHYQKTGFSWMLQNMHLGFGSILADDMGLGKTIQLLTLVVHLKENNLIDNAKVLVVAPTSILTNWTKEIEKFTPSLKAKIYHGLKRKFPSDDYDILLTSYGVLRRDLDEINSHDWFLLVIDEAQNIKNPKSKQTIAVKSVEATHHIALSGTPVENHLYEYWSIFDFINKGYLGALKQFRDKFITPIEKHRDSDILEDFKKITSPFILRRLKTDKKIISDLPDKIINDVYCNLTVKQASMYEETLNQLIQEVEDSDGIKRKGLVLKLITALKQICNHPAQFSKSDEFKISESGKMEVLANILENILGNDEKVLIFTQYVEMGKILQKLIENKFDEEVMFLHGGVSRDNRDEMIDRFQNGNNKIFILSLRAGGIGLNLTAALNVIHYDLWWNPAVENQATDRAYRLGQTDNVMVYRFITSGTLEERINQILLEKRQLVEMTVEGSESFITEMTNDELKDMLNLRSEE